jgi:guanylate kinase
VLFDIDWQGTEQLSRIEAMRPDLVRVFVLPPTMEELERRLRARNTDSDEVIAARMARAANEISHGDGYDYGLIHDDVEDCYGEVIAILRAERLKRRRQIGLIGFARDLIRSVPEADTKL